MSTPASPTSPTASTGVAPPSNRSVFSVIRSAATGALGFVIAWTIIDAVQRARGTATDGAANPNQRPALLIYHPFLKLRT
jgi:hypothetical protein